MKRLISIGASTILLAGGLGLAVAPSAAAAGGDAWFLSSGMASSPEFWTSVAYGDGNFVAVADSSDATAYSPDGITWYPGGNLPGVFSMWEGSLAYGNNLFVVVAQDSNATMWSADNGRTWNEGGSAPEALTWTNVTYGNGVFVAVATEGTPPVAISMWSADGKAWTAAPLPGDSQGIAFGNGVFVVLNDIGDVIFDDDVFPNGVVWSSDGKTWQTSQTPGGFAPGQVAFGGGRFVATGWDGNTDSSIWSLDGKTWQSGGVVNLGDYGANALAFGVDRFVALITGPGTDSAPGSKWSTDGVTWSQGGALPNGGGGGPLAFGEEVFVTPAGYLSNQFMYSQSVGQPDVISLVGTMDGKQTNWVNGGTYYATFGSRINFQASSSSGVIPKGPYVFAGQCLVTEQGSADSVFVGQAPGQTCVLTVDAAGGNGFRPSAQQVKYYVVATKGKQQPSLTPRASGKMGSGQVVHLQTKKLHSTNAGQSITWRITRGEGKACSLKKGTGKAVSVRLKSKGTCTVVGTAPADSARNWNPMKVKRTYKIT